MSSSTDGPKVIRVSQKGQATIPKPLREKFGIESPGEVFIYEDEGRIVIEPVPDLAELHGVHAGEGEPGAVLAKVRAEREREKRRETDRAAELRPDDG